MTKTIGDVHKEHGRYLLMLLRGFGVPDDDREDVRQDIYVRLLKQNISPERCTTAYLGAVARSAANSYRRERYGRLLCDACGERYTSKTGHCTACGTPHTRHESIALLEYDDEGAAHVNNEVESMAEQQWVQAMEESARRTDAAFALDVARLYRCGSTTFTAYDLIAMLHSGWTHERIAKECQVSDRTVRQWLRGWYAFITKELADLQKESL